MAPSATEQSGFISTSFRSHFYLEMSIEDLEKALGVNYNAFNYLVKAILKKKIELHNNIGEFEKVYK